MKTTRSITDYAIYETRIVQDPETCGNCTKRMRGWFDRDTGRYWGSNFNDASDAIQTTYGIEITR